MKNFLSLYFIKFRFAFYSFLAWIAPDKQEFIRKKVMAGTLLVTIASVFGSCGNPGVKCYDVAAPPDSNRTAKSDSTEVLLCYQKPAKPDSVTNRVIEDPVKKDPDTVIPEKKPPVKTCYAPRKVEHRTPGN